MNLRMPDAPALVAYLHDVVVENGIPLLSFGDVRVVESRGLVFYHCTAPAHPEVGGPYQSVEHLLRTEGMRRYAELRSAGDPSPLFEAIEWRGFNFDVDPSSARLPRAHQEVRAAIVDADRVRRVNADAHLVTARGIPEDEWLLILECLFPSPGLTILVDGHVMDSRCAAARRCLQSEE